MSNKHYSPTKLKRTKDGIIAFDYDGVVSLGICPGKNDIIITGRCLEEYEIVFENLHSRGIYNMVLFNPMTLEERGADDLSSWQKSGKHKVKTLRKLKKRGIKIDAFFDDDPVQISIIKKSISYSSNISGKIMYIDWRLPENRLEGFCRYYYWRKKLNDLDHGHFQRGCTRDLDQEGKFWFSQLFGQTYRSATSWAYFYHYPDPKKIDFNQLKEWYSKNWWRFPYATDTKYNKGHFVSMTESYVKWLDGKTQYDRIMPLIDGPDSKENFHRLYNEALKWHKYGRMAAWIYCQCLWETNQELNILPDVMFVDHEGSWSLWNGLMFVYNLENERLIDKQSKYVPTSEHKEEAVRLGHQLKEELERRYKDIKVEYFTIESALCQYKKMHQGRDYPGHSTGDFTAQYHYFSRIFPEVDWSNYKKACDEVLPPLTWKVEVPGDNELFAKTGHMIYLDAIFKDCPSVPSTAKDPKNFDYYISESKIGKYLVRDRIPEKKKVTLF